MKYTKDKIEEIRLQLEKYIKEEEMPRLSDFCYKHDIRKQRMYEFYNAKEGDSYYNSMFSDTFKKMEEKEEAKLWEYGLMNVTNSTMSIFRLKQKPFCYTDKQDNNVVEATEVLELIKSVTDAVNVNKKVVDL